MVDQRDEFISEAQEIIEGLARDLLALDASLKRKEGVDHELINDTFRAVHTLKGLSGLFGVARMSTLSHHLEDLLDEMRLGRVELTPRVLDVLFRAVEVYGQILAALRAGEPEPARVVDDLLSTLDDSVSRPTGAAANPLAEYDLDPGLLAVLTEYEEHRLRTNLQQGVGLFVIRVRFDLATIDGALDNLKSRAKPHGEILTYLPSGEGGDAESIDLDVLLASRQSLDVLRTELAGPNVQIEAVARRGGPHRAASEPPATTFGGQAPRVTTPPAAPEDLFAVAPGTAPRGPIGPILEEEPQATDAPRQGLSIRGVAQTVRVDIRKLDHLMNIVAELAIVRSALSRITDRVRGAPELRELGIELHRLHRGLDRHLGDLQSGILEVRMVPLGQVFDKLARVVRQISREHDKEVNLVITGAETEVDKLIVEELSDPLMHMIRNAIDHGIEGKRVREERGKPEAGTIALNAYQKGNHVVLEVQDDGAGIDEDRVLATAIKRGLVSPSEVEALLQRDVLGFIFMPGFTTKAGADELSGRGVGMDVVKTNISKLGGVIDVHSELGIGTKMTVTLPITLAIISALVVVIAGRRYALPLASVLEALVFDPSSVRTIEGREVMTLRGATLALCRLDAFFGLPRPPSATSSARRFVVVVGVGNHRLGCVVDQLIGQQDIVIKPLGKSLEGVRGFAGATELGDQHVGLVIDAPAIVEEILAAGDASRLLGARRGGEA
ncbi:MAG: chemotaxis protein CheA [Sandaracinaceae bacterium]|nr:chemotaxis protein CheA [Sandaracinaceae bacterium]